MTKHKLGSMLKHWAKTNSYKLGDPRSMSKGVSQRMPEVSDAFSEKQNVDKITEQP